MWLACESRGLRPPCVQCGFYRASHDKIPHALPPHRAPHRAKALSGCNRIFKILNAKIAGEFVLYCLVCVCGLFVSLGGFAPRAFNVDFTMLRTTKYHTHSPRIEHHIGLKPSAVATAFVTPHKQSLYGNFAVLFPKIPAGAFVPFVQGLGFDGHGGNGTGFQTV